LDALSQRILLKRRELWARILAARNALQPSGQGPEARAVLWPLRPARAHDLVEDVGTVGWLVETTAAADVRWLVCRNLAVCLDHVGTKPRV